MQQSPPLAAACYWASSLLLCPSRPFAGTLHLLWTGPCMPVIHSAATLKPLLQLTKAHGSFQVGCCRRPVLRPSTCAMKRFPCGSSMPATSSAAACRMDRLSSTSSLYSSRACSGQGPHMLLTCPHMQGSAPPIFLTCRGQCLHSSQACRGQGPHMLPTCRGQHLTCPPATVLVSPALSTPVMSQGASAPAPD